MPFYKIITLLAALPPCSSGEAIIDFGLQQIARDMRDDNEQ
jgi:hypothetical protein